MNLKKGHFSLFHSSEPNVRILIIVPGTKGLLLAGCRCCAISSGRSIRAGELRLSGIILVGMIGGGKTLRGFRG